MKNKKQKKLRCHYCEKNVDKVTMIASGSTLMISVPVCDKCKKERFVILK